MFLTFELSTCFIGGFTSIMESQSIAYLVIGSAHINWILDLEGEVHSIWDLWTNILQVCSGNVFFWSWAGRATIFGRVHKISKKHLGVALARICLPQQVRREYLSVRPMIWVSRCYDKPTWGSIAQIIPLISSDIPKRSLLGCLSTPLFKAFMINIKCNTWCIKEYSNIVLFVSYFYCHFINYCHAEKINSFKIKLVNLVI